MRWLVAWAAGFLAMPSPALEPRDARGLSVVVERIPESVLVDGLGVRIQTATGADVPQLAARIAQRWRREGSQLHQSRQAAWQLLARLEDGHSEVIQWRGSGTSAQLLHSVVDAMRAPARPTAAPFTLPSHCAWGRVIEGEAGAKSYEQRTGWCRADASHVLAALRQRLPAQGWSLEGEGMALQLSRAGSAGELIVGPDPAREGSAVVWVATRPPGQEGR